MTPGHSMVLVAAGRAKALAEARTQFQAEKRKAEAQCARFAKRQAAMLEYERRLANSPYKPHIQVLGREPKLQVFLEPLRKYGVVPAISAGGNSYGSMDAGMLVVRGSAGTAGEAARGGSSEASASARPPQQFREGMNYPDCLRIYPPQLPKL